MTARSNLAYELFLPDLFSTFQRGQRCAAAAHLPLMCSLLTVEASPLLVFAPRVLERQEPMGVQALLVRTPVEALDPGVVGRLAWSREVGMHEQSAYAPPS